MRKVIEIYECKDRVKYELIENKSTKYFNGSIWESNNFGDFEIVGRSNRVNTQGRYPYFLCKFEDRTVVEALFKGIREGGVKNPNFLDIIKKYTCKTGFKYELIKNNNKIYFNNSKWKTNNFGEFKIVGKTNRVNNEGRYRYYLCKFDDGTVIEAFSSNIENGTIKNPNCPIIYGIGYIGQGKYTARVNGEKTKEYRAWYNMFYRCYSGESPTYSDCTVDPYWHSFQNFCESLPSINGYDLWVDSNIRMCLDKDIKIKDNKIYSKDTCKFVTHDDNTASNNKTQTITGLTYIAKRISDGYEEEFTNQHKFARKYGLHQTSVNKCVLGRQKITKGWEITIKEE